MRCSYLLLTLFTLLHFQVKSQTGIRLYSILSDRCGNAKDGYTFDSYFYSRARGKILFPSNFSPGGIYGKQIILKDSFAVTGSFLDIGKSPVQILFAGSLNQANPDFEQFSPAEMDSLYAWSLQGGKLIIASQPNITGFDFRVFDQKWGFSIQNDLPGYFIPTPLGEQTLLFNGPFGRVDNASQGGAAQGYFDQLPPETAVLATNLSGKPTIVLDCRTYDLIIADADAFSIDGGISTGLTIGNDQDRLLGNLMAFMEELQRPEPGIILECNRLRSSHGGSIQWELNGQFYSAASSIEVVEPGTYRLLVRDSYGCAQRSDSMYIDPTTLPQSGFSLPSAFTPNKDDLNNLWPGEAAGLSEEVLIFNRWGEVMMHLKPGENWDGTYRGMPVPAGCYFYLVKASGSTCKNEDPTGAIHLLR